MPTFSFTVSSYTPFTKILSANINSDRADLVTFLNTTKIDDTNIQTNGITRNGATSKLKTGTANFVVINGADGNMSEEAQLAITRGGTGLNIAPGSQSPGDVIQVNSSSSGLTVGAPLTVPASLRIYQFYKFS